jgi:hypothetical protein
MLSIKNINMINNSRKNSFVQSQPGEMMLPNTSGFRVNVLQKDTISFTAKPLSIETIQAHSLRNATGLPFLFDHFDSATNNNVFKSEKLVLKDKVSELWANLETDYKISLRKLSEFALPSDKGVKDFLDYLFVFDFKFGQNIKPKPEASPFNTKNESVFSNRVSVFVDVPSRKNEVKICTGANNRPKDNYAVIDKKIRKYLLECANKNKVFSYYDERYELSTFKEPIPGTNRFQKGILIKKTFLRSGKPIQ